MDERIFNSLKSRCIAENKRPLTDRMFEASADINTSQLIELLALEENIVPINLETIESNIAEIQQSIQLINELTDSIQTLQATVNTLNQFGLSLQSLTYENRVRIEQLESIHVPVEPVEPEGSET